MRTLLPLLVLGCRPPTAPAPEPLAVWIDADPSVGLADRDVDDGLAMVQAVHSPELAIRGFSWVFGNAPLEDAVRIGDALVASLAPSTPTSAGASGPGEADTAAVVALEAALEREPLTILALGPATNVAALLTRRPDLASRIERVIAVAGRRPGQRFVTGATDTRGHRDFNFEKDPDAFATLLASGVPLVLAPWELSAQVHLRASEVEAWQEGPAATRTLIEPARGWLDTWDRRFGVDAFNPFDTLAVGLLVRPELIGCADLPADIQVLPDDRAEADADPVPTKPYLLVAKGIEAPTRVTWCATVDAEAFRDDLQRRLLDAPRD